jgi:transposase
MKPEILEGPERRRRWRAEDKARIVAETLATGVKVADVARRHGLSRSLLYGWRREKARRAAELGAPDLVPVVVAKADGPPAPSPIETAVRESGIEIALPSGIRVVMHGKVDAKALRAVLAALRPA